MGLFMTRIFPGTAPRCLQPVAVPERAKADSTSAERPSCAPGAEACVAPRSARALEWQRLLVVAALFAAPAAFLLLYTPPEGTAYAQGAASIDPEWLAVADACAKRAIQQTRLSGPAAAAQFQADPLTPPVARQTAPNQWKVEGSVHATDGRGTVFTKWHYSCSAHGRSVHMRIEATVRSDF